MILQGVRSVIEKPQAKGFKVAGHKLNNEFKCLETKILDAIVDIFTKDEHDGSMERSILTIKECLICVSQNTPYNRITRFMVTRRIFDVITRLNTFTNQDGVSNILSPCKKVLGKVKLDYDTHKITTGDYHQV